MGNQEKIDILKKGVEVWNEYKKQYPPKKITDDFGDFGGADLSGANLRGVDFSGMDLFGVNLSRADLSEADLSYADLDGADLKEAHLNGANLTGITLTGGNLFQTNLRGADLSGAHLSTANLLGADLSGAHLAETNLSRANLLEANLSKANLTRARLIGADLRRADLREAILYKAKLNGTNLSGANFSQASFNETSIDSRLVLDSLLISLTEEQKAGIIFSDERKEAKKKKEAKVTQPFPYLEIEFQDTGPWKNEWLAALLMSIQVTYNNIFYLITTDEKEIDIIKSKIERGCSVGAQNDIELKQIQIHSPLFLQYIQFAAEYAPQVATVLGTLASVFLAIPKGFKILMEARKIKVEAELKEIEVEERRLALDTKKKELFSKKEMEPVEKELQQIKIPTKNKTVLENQGSLFGLGSKNFMVIIAAIEETANIKIKAVEMKQYAESDFKDQNSGKNDT